MCFGRNTETQMNTEPNRTETLAETLEKCFGRNRDILPQNRGGCLFFVKMALKTLLTSHFLSLLTKKMHSPSVLKQNIPDSAETFFQCFGQSFGSGRFGIHLCFGVSAETQNLRFGRALSTPLSLL